MHQIQEVNEFGIPLSPVPEERTIWAWANIELTSEQREVLGRLADATSFSDDKGDVLNGLYEAAIKERYGDHIARLKRLQGLQLASQLLIQRGYPFQDTLDGLNAGLDKLTQTVRDNLLRHFVSLQKESERTRRVLIGLIGEDEFAAGVAKCRSN
jgi:hypothetical protein